MPARSAAPSMIAGIMTVMIMAPTGAAMTMITIMVMGGSVTSVLRKEFVG